MTTSPKDSQVSASPGTIKGEPISGTTPKGRAAVAVLLVVSLIASGLTRQWAMDRRALAQVSSEAVVNRSSTDSSLNALPSFATALLLGGLRGPLVMFLWPMTERQKSDRNLEDVDTEIEWIRLLQPEFDTVHLFQIWNKAYNLSVQMSSLANKYTTILDALDYAQKVEASRPDDINIVTAVQGVYETKLGTSSEHVFYRARVRRETQTLIRLAFPDSRGDEFRAAAGKLGWVETEAPLSHSEKNHTYAVFLDNALYTQLAKVFGGADVIAQPDIRRPGQPLPASWKKNRLDPMVDLDGRIFPELLEPRYPRPANLAVDQPWYDGSRLQYLAQYQPFPYGISVLALAYNESKRAEALLNLRHQHPIEAGSTDPVIDSRPGICLEQWVADEWERGRRFELQMAGHPANPNFDPVALEIPDGQIKLTDPIVNPGAREAAIYSYSLASRLSVDARDEFVRHIRGYPQFAQTYLVHLDDATCDSQLMLADSLYLQAIGTASPAREQLMKDAAEHYDIAVYALAMTILKFYVDDEVAAQTYPIDPATGKRYTRTTIESADSKTVLSTLGEVKKENEIFFQDPATKAYSASRDQFRDDRNQYEAYLGHCALRLDQLRPAADTQPISH
jgi:hypothetical protein